MDRGVRPGRHWVGALRDLTLLIERSEDFNEGIRAFLEKRKPVYIRR